MVLDDETTMKLYCDAAQQLATSKVTAAIAEGLAVGRLKTLLKDNGKVRGIVTGKAHGRLVAKTLAQQFGTVFDEETAPYQFALSTRAGTDALSHLLRATTETDPNVVVVAIDGVGAFDHIRRKAIFDKLLAVRNSRASSRPSGFSTGVQQRTCGKTTRATREK